MGLVFVDVEATGTSPYSGVMTEFGAVEFTTNDTFHGVLWESEPDPTNPAKSQIVQKLLLSEEQQLEHEREVMDQFASWLKGYKGRPIFVSDNVAYDFQWVNFYFDKTLGSNPFGHSGRRISDFYAGLMRDFYRTQEWKQWRITQHDHNPVHDALGNVEAFRKLLEIAREP
jgi:DNA polymerase III epsilon subunit-like protein